MKNSFSAIVLVFSSMDTGLNLNNFWNHPNYFWTIKICVFLCFIFIFLFFPSMHDPVKSIDINLDENDMLRAVLNLI